MSQSIFIESGLSRSTIFLFSLLVLIFWTASPVAAKHRPNSFVIKSLHKFPAASDRKQQTAAAHSAVKAKKQEQAAPANDPPAAEEVEEQAKEPVLQPEVRTEAPDPALRKKLSARSAIVMDANTGQVLYAHDPDRPGQPASTIKVITSLIAIGSLRDDEMVQASPHAASMPSSKVNLCAGRSYLADDLINAVLLASANDASVALAEKVAGSEGSFAQLMTSKARALGATNTLCKTANGLTAEGQHTTARDLATIFNRAMSNPEFAERIGRTTVRTRFGQTLRNHNKALWRMDGAVGGKTGYTVAARQTYVGKFSRHHQEVVVAILGSETMWADLSKLVAYGFAKEQQLAGRGTGGGSRAEVSSDGQLGATRVSTVFRNDELKVLNDSKKHSAL